MDPAPVMRHAQAYGPQADGHSTYPMEAQSIPQPFPGSLGAQGMEYQGYSGVDGAQGWPQRVLGEMKDMLLLLNADGRVTYASSSCKSITGYTAKQLEGKMFSNFTHKDDRAIVSYELDHCVTTGCALRLHLRFNRMSDSFCVLEAYGHPHMSGEGGSSGNTKRCDGVFLVCQPYSSRGSQLLDSFLEHKVENIRLMQQIAKLKEEEEEETNPSRQSYPKTENLNSKSLYNPHRRFTSSHATGFPGPSVPDMTTSAEEYESSDTVANFDEASPTSFAEALSHIEGIEIMTGLYYGDGERSQGISTGTRRGRLIQCDTDATVVDQQSRNTEEGDRRKRLKGEHQCADCGTSDSPEWRKGPNGPKTLCNACGLRWAKKKRQLPS